ncbi:MAG TPA: lysylphosphatidylglycerol synthase domain-containing protein [Dehalococcoidia bacterium]|nr:lysylphosphatidylglycerol synthase domain-containing protein [Dehalococcoidia bacterium]
MANFRWHYDDPASTKPVAQRLFDVWGLVRRGGWRRPIFGDALNVGFDILTFFLLFFAASYSASPGRVLPGCGLPPWLASSVLPGGMGVVEGGMVARYEALGVASGVAVVGDLRYRLLSFWIPVLIGVPLTPYWTAR